MIRREGGEKIKGGGPKGGYIVRWENIPKERKIRGKYRITVGQSNKLSERYLILKEK